MSSDLGTGEAGKAREARETRAVRKARGIVHTPPEIARHGVARVAALLERDFDCALSDCVVLDPAVGPGVWLEAALSHVSHGTFVGFDVDGEALATARALLGPACDARRVDLRLNEANTLSVASPWPDDRVRVILGNPPWAARSLSRGNAQSDLALRDFLRDHAGEPLAERRAGVLSDDYVRFFRWAIEQAATSPHGAVVCLATNNSFLDGPVHRGMRARLCETFAHIEILDFGGNALITRKGEKDENVFGVRVGAALTVLTRPPVLARARVHYARLRGTRDAKLGALEAAPESSVRFEPAPPLLRFVPTAPARTPHADFGLDEAFPFHREGVQTNRDALVTASDRSALLARMDALLAGELPLAPSRHLDPVSTLARLREARDRLPIAELAYRPLEDRVVCTLTPLCHRPRPELGVAMQHASWALLSSRKDRGERPFSLFAPTRLLADACFLSVRSSCRTRVFPTHTPAGDDNLAPGLRDRLEQALGVAVNADTLLAYALGVLASETFRAQAGEALKHDYPRVPVPREASALFACAEAGKRLRAALCDRELGPSPLRVVGAAPSEIVSPAAGRLLPDAGRLTFGDASLEGVPSRAFSAQVGHWPVIERFLRSELPVPLARVLDVVTRASMWADALAYADVAFADHASL